MDAIAQANIGQVGQATYTAAVASAAAVPRQVAARPHAGSLGGKPQQPNATRHTKEPGRTPPRPRRMGWNLDVQV